ncbi:hypothetical protein [Cellulomonas fimi]|uniref:Uncharacterized protein n=1 Tax=Cellulomonas fimi (strain ATCC 484 / DSM 20113 / JCM 1341 / CCUG 24087 / LMG 16345 / NBRC 15513 / NCIMB 8980 / NCTC 7547 / NRS-133) TaxID=590998 RepID=F4H282_CELFA|nr:hypothetical protein [Cellulomonas fimi]AEE46379.1 hypothetical protein Celf_2251 [Cellulomonas fimi ATCC 484]NNH07179.1 hypothetical protein [Cellulomonas fimi]VEH32757.1 Uncharacterised protein [Cellulomonas fimi]
MSRSRVILTGSVAALVIIAGGVLWFSRQSESGLTLETSDGVTFLRNHGEQVGDDVAHTGRIFIAEDGCLYVTPDDEGETYLVALGPRATVTSDEIRLSWGVVKLDSSATFGRANVEGAAPARTDTRCTLTREVYGLA